MCGEVLKLCGFIFISVDDLGLGLFLEIGYFYMLIGLNVGEFGF